MTQLPNTLLANLSAAYEAVASESRLRRLETTVIRLSMLGLGAHLLLIALGRGG